MCPRVGLPPGRCDSRPYPTRRVGLLDDDTGGFMIKLTDLQPAKRIEWIRNQQLLLDDAVAGEGPFGASIEQRLLHAAFDLPSWGQVVALLDRRKADQRIHRIAGRSVLAIQ